MDKFLFGNPNGARYGVDRLKRILKADISIQWPIAFNQNNPKRKGRIRRPNKRPKKTKQVNSEMIMIIYLKPLSEAPLIICRIQGSSKLPRKRSENFTDTRKKMFVRIVLSSSNISYNYIFLAILNWIKINYLHSYLTHVPMKLTSQQNGCVIITLASRSKIKKFTVHIHYYIYIRCN